jgi:hypothetical protein
MLLSAGTSRNQARRFAIASVALELFQRTGKTNRRPPRRRQHASTPSKRKRQRRSVQDIYEMLGPYYFRRAFRMSYQAFWRLASLILPFMNKRNLAKAHVNGPILPSVRLASALRYFAGGVSYDIATSFGIANCEVLESVWEVVDAIHAVPSLTIQYPESHDKQHQIANAFCAKSAANFDCCVGAIDGILIWIHRPSQKCCVQAGCDVGKFFCGRKHKFGLNCQAICDAEGRFLDMSIMYPGSTADCLAFEGMAVYRKLEEGILAPGLCLFGDNAYLNTTYMATPYSGTTTASKDSYNYYHSQLRIQIECAFGKFTQRWGILRSALPKQVTVKKTVALVLALAKLHNFCIDERQSVDAATARDTSHIEQVGGVPLVAIEHDENIFVPRQLLGAGEHFEGIDRNERRRLQRSFTNIQLPRERLLALVLDAGLQRPRTSTVRVD